MTNETEKAGATRTEAVKAKAYAMPEEAACHYLIEEYEKLEAELSALRASQQAPVEGLPEGCPKKMMYGPMINAQGGIRRGALLHEPDGACSEMGCVLLEINTPGTAARLAALENKEKE